MKEKVRNYRDSISEALVVGDDYREFATEAVSPMTYDGIDKRKKG